MMKDLKAIALQLVKEHYELHCQLNDKVTFERIFESAKECKSDVFISCCDHALITVDRILAHNQEWINALKQNLGATVSGDGDYVNVKQEIINLKNK